MYKVWCGSSGDSESLARELEVHLNEYADEIVSVSYSVNDRHYVLAVYRLIESGGDAREEAAVSVAEQIIDEAYG